MNCIKCQQEIIEGAKFCPFCGTNQQLNNCPNCNFEVKEGYNFCPNCNHQLLRDDNIVKVEKRLEEKIITEKIKHTRSKEKLYAWITLPIYSFMLLLMLLFFFLPIGRVNATDLFKQLTGTEKMEDISIDYSIVDSMAIFQYILEDNEPEDIIEYYNEIMLENLDRSILEEIGSNGFSNLTASQQRKFAKAMEEINPFYFYTVEDTRVQSSLSIAFIIIINIVYIAAFITILVFFILSIINLCYRRKITNILTFSLWTLTVSLIVILTISYYNNTASFKTGAGPILLVIFSGLLFTGVLVTELITKRKKLIVNLLVKKFVTVVALIFMIFLVNGRGMKYTYNYTTVNDVEKVIVDKESINKITNLFDYLLFAYHEPFSIQEVQENTSLLLERNNIKRNTIILEYEIDSIGIFIYEDIYELITPEVLLGIITIFHIASLVFLVIMIKKNLNGLVSQDDKVIFSNNLFLAMMIVFWTTIIISIAILNGFLFQYVDFLGKDYGLKAGIGYYFVVIISIALVVWNTVFKVKPRMSI